MLTMRSGAVGRVRMRSSGLTGRPFESAAAAVRHHGAMQAQEYALAKWAVGQRTDGLAEPGVNRAIDEGEIVRTHVLRPTWHFVAAEDVRWLLALTGPRVRKMSAARWRELGLDPKTLARAEAVVGAALGGGRHLTRKELGDVFDEEGIDRSGQRFPHILMHLELDAVICSGVSRGSRHSYALLDERVPATAPLDREEALARLTRRYLGSHGPATAQDLRWWSSLPAADVALGLELLGADVVSETVDDVPLWSLANARDRALRSPRPHLLHVYDELVVGYTRSRFFGDPNGAAALAAWRDRSVPGNVLLVDGHVAGNWRRTLDKDGVRLEVHALEPLDATGLRALGRAAAELGRFLGRSATLDVAGADSRGPG